MKTIQNPLPALRRLAFLPVGIAAVLALHACTYDKEEVLYPPVTCDSSAVSFSAYVMPLVRTQCLSCHDLSSASGNVVLEQYSDFAPYTSSGKLVTALEYTIDSLAMPPDGKLPDCDIAKIRTWVRVGAPNN